ncbi:hypothetical protein NU219Hw_g7118t1 [Hortaea werneckii]
MASRRPTQPYQQQQQSQEQQQVTSSSWFLNSSTGLYYYYNAPTDEFIYQDRTRVPRPNSIPRDGLLEQHREAGSNNSQQTALSDSPNGRSDRINYIYAAGAQFDDREDSSAEEVEAEDDDDSGATEQQINAITQRGYAREEALRFIFLTQQQGYGREQAAVMALQQSRQGHLEQQRRRRRR